MWLLAWIACAGLLQPPAVAEKPGRVTVASLPAAARSAVTQRAAFVYRMPDGSVWDSYYYIEFRKVLAEFDAVRKGESVPARCAAWGFSAGSRQVSAESRPRPLWQTLQPPKDNSTYTPFIYVNTKVGVGGNARLAPAMKIGKEVAAGVFEFSYWEYPGDDGAFARLPCSISLGYATGYVRLPAGLHAGTDGSLSGEFFLLGDQAVGLEAKSPASTRGYRLVHASTLRLTPDAYAAELRAGRAELVVWSFTRAAGRLGDRFEWRREVVEVGKDKASEQTGP